MRIHKGTAMTKPAIELRGVTKRFGRKEVLKDVSFEVPEGRTFAFLGRNGAGKTTTINLLLGLLRPESGTVRVLDMDPRTEAVKIRERVGYMAEDQTMYGWMRVKEILGFVAPFYPTWDKAHARELADRLELPMATKVKHLSKGQNCRLALLLALAHRPGLVILDDPTLGLDPIMRKQFLRDVVQYLQGDGVTVFFSSHLLYEVEPVADAVLILEGGRILRQADTEDLRADVKRLVMPKEAWQSVGELPGVLDTRNGAREVAVVAENAAEALARCRAAGVEPRVVDLNLDEIFEAYVIGSAS